MSRPGLVVLLMLPLLLGGTPARAAAADDTETFFETRIRPLLAMRCFKCHGGEKTSSGLRVDSRAALLTGGDRGPALVSGDANTSALMRAVRRGEDLKMPPDAPLAADEITALETWINQGAPWPAATAKTGLRAARHWAFEPVAPVNVPDDASGWSISPVDRFIAATRSAAGLQPQQPADRRTLARRAAFDLLGIPLPPTEVEAFAADPAPDAFDRLIERMLASPAYGERWGRHWMDVVRYADTAGDNADYPVPEARRYRDYIIASFNADKPYDEFIREQLAGDILANRHPKDRARYAERVTATGFLALSRRYATAPYELWHLTLEDTIDTTGRALLGLSLRCARCHDHKFDPVTAEDYYALYGIFASTQFPWAGAEELASKKFPRQHFVPLLPPADAENSLATRRQLIATVEAELQTAERNDADVLRLAEVDAQLKSQAEVTPSGGSSGGAPGATVDAEALKKERSEINKRVQERLGKLRERVTQLHRPGLPIELPGAYAVSEGKVADAPLQRHGEPAEAADAVRRGAPKFLTGGKSLDIPPGASGRLELAEWLTRPEHPLTARVIVNRVWQRHFGKGLVATPSDFGLRGEPPTHPELLDWLTARFVADGWSIKNLHRQIMRSATYQMASGADSAATARDPGNRLYWRFDRRRLEAESIRDAILLAAGQLDQRVPADHPFPPFEKWGWTQHTPFKAVFPSQHRSVYLMTQRLLRHPFLALFDGPDTNVSTDIRTSATVPLQALYLMNDPFVTEQATAFATRLAAAAPDPQGRIDQAFQLAYGRAPRGDERERGLAYLKQYADECTASGAPPEAAQRDAWTSYARVLLSANEFVFIE